jgi:hypothetical protein
MTVFVTQELKGRDLSGALLFGELEVLVRANVPVTQQNMEKIAEGMDRKLERFDPYHDYLLLSGDPILMGMACSIITCFQEEEGVGPISFLRWNRIDERYEVVTFQMA